MKSMPKKYAKAFIEYIQKAQNSSDEVAGSLR